jgi:hypothetical protein
MIGTIKANVSLTHEGKKKKVGAVPLITGLVGVCLLAPLFGYTLAGQRKARSVQEANQRAYDNYHCS